MELTQAGQRSFDFAYLLHAHEGDGHLTELTELTELTGRVGLTYLVVFPPSVMWIPLWNVEWSKRLGGVLPSSGLMFSPRLNLMQADQRSFDFAYFFRASPHGHLPELTELTSRVGLTQA